MNSLQRRLRIPVMVTLLATGLMWAGSARANVYASNIKVNGSLTNSVSASQGSSVAISYILNDAATAGVTITISSGGTVVRTITIPSGAGTTKGLNTVNWDGKDGSNNNVATGTYSVSITAAATGYADWTLISDNTSPTTHVYRPYGIAVDNNTNSPYYGRIFIGNAHTLAGSTTNGDTIGIVKCNADGSYADDGAFSQFDYSWYDDGADSPIYMQVAPDDNVYFNDWAVGKGKVVGVDPALTHSFVVWDSPNQVNSPIVAYTTNGTPIPPNWLSTSVEFVGTDHPMLFAGDVTYPSDGCFAWYLTMTNGHLYADPTLIVTNDDGSTRCDNSAGQQVIQTGGDLALRCDGIQVDVNSNLYVMENRGNVGDPAMRAAMFPNWDGKTDLFMGSTWDVGGADDTFRNLRTLALDSRTNPQKLAIGEYTSGGADANGFIGGGIRVLNALDGSTIYTNLCVTNFYRSVAWDNVGNLYGGTSQAVGTLRSRWQAISPPGANQATTPAFATIQITGAVTAPHISSINYNNGAVTINFTGDSADAPTSFTLQSSSTVNTGYANVIGAVATQNSPGSFTFTTVATGSTQFYRISR